MTDQPSESAANPGVNTTGMRTMLRREKIALRLDMLPEAHRQASARILDHLGELLLPRPAGTIGFCLPIRAEVDCQSLIVKLLAAGWRATIPTVVAKDAPMQFRPWTRETPMTVDPYDLPVPMSGRGPVPDVLLLPLVACDASGYRLGYGGGYFDRTLAICAPRPFTIGVGFELAVAATIYPEAHDIPLDCLVTEAGIRQR